MRVILGNIVCDDCDAALVVNGVEVFRFRDRTGDGQLVVDFDIRDQQGNRLVKVAKNNVVHAADGYSVRHEPRRSSALHQDTGTIAMVEEKSTQSILVFGEFWIDGVHVVLFENGAAIDSNLISGGYVKGCGTVIVVERGSTQFGVMRPPPREEEEGL